MTVSAIFAGVIIIIDVLLLGLITVRVIRHVNHDDFAVNTGG